MKSKERREEQNKGRKKLNKEREQKFCRCK
jgi:hypothetical protein